MGVTVGCKSTFESFPYFFLQTLRYHWIVAAIKHLKQKKIKSLNTTYDEDDNTNINIKIKKYLKQNKIKSLNTTYDNSNLNGGGFLDYLKKK